MSENGVVAEPLVLDLDSLPSDAASPDTGPAIVVGVGDPAHPRASICDVIVEPPISVEGVLAAIRAQPIAAKVVKDLLRVIENMPVDDALMTESMAYGLLQGSNGHQVWRASKSANASASTGEVLLARTGNRLDITFNRPADGNAIDVVMRDALREAFELAQVDTQIAEIHWWGEGKAFSLGADLSEFGTTSDPATAHAIRMQTLAAPLIAACADRLTVHVQGACVGAGLEMAAFAGRIEAQPNAWFQLPELAMGILPGAGGCVSVSRRIGRHRTALMILSGKRINARTALDWGLIDAIVDD